MRLKQGDAKPHRGHGPDRGGHLALMVRLEQYAGLVTEFIQARTR